MFLACCDQHPERTEGNSILTNSSKGRSACVLLLLWGDGSEFTAFRTVKTQLSMPIKMLQRMHFTVDKITRGRTL
jgi:hypothetical protein